MLARISNHVEFLYKINSGGIKGSLKFTFNDDGTATLENPICRYCTEYWIIGDQSVLNPYSYKKCRAIFDLSVAKYLKEIEAEASRYTFKVIEKIWYINHLPTPNQYPADVRLNFVRGDMTDNSRNIIFANPILFNPEIAQ